MIRTCGTVRPQTSRMLKKFAQWAAGESKPEACPQGYVEDFDEPRTKLEDFFSILLNADKLIRLFLHPNFGLRSMPRHHDRRIVQAIQSFSYGLFDGIEVSTPEIGSPDAAAKERIAGHNEVVVRKMKTHGPRAVAGRMESNS